MPARAVKLPQTQTEIAVLQIQVKNIEENVHEIKDSLKEVHDCIDRNAEETRKMLSELRDSDLAAHKELSVKVGALERWRWMMMGAGIVIGSLGFDTIAKLLK